MTEILPIEKELLAEIETVLESAPALSRSAFGKKACGDHKIIKKLEDGHEVRSSTINAIRNFIAQCKPPQQETKT